MPIKAALVFLTASLTSIYGRAEEVQVTPANPIIALGPYDDVYIDGFEPLVMPLVDPTALDNTPEDVIRQYAPLATEEKPAVFYLLVDYTDDEYDIVKGRVLRPNAFLSLLGSVVPNSNKHVVRVRGGHRLFGKYILHRHFTGDGQEYYMMYLSKRYDETTKKWVLCWHLTY